MPLPSSGVIIYIIQDSREKSPLSFHNKPYIEGVKVQKLDAGDYSIVFSDGFEPPIVFERKEVFEIFGTLSKGFSRFKKELLRAKNKELQVIILVNGSLNKVLQGSPFSKRSPESIVKQIFTLMIKYNIWTAFMASKEEMAEFIYQYALAYARARNKVAKTD